MHRFLLLILLSVLVSGCSGDSQDRGSAAAKGGSAAGKGGSAAYPALYTSAKLPQYPGAKLVDTGRQTTSIRDGLRLTLETSDEVKKVAAFFESEMTKLGWTFPEKRVRPENLDLTKYTKDDLYFQITILRSPDAQLTKITIIYAQQ